MNGAGEVYHNTADQPTNHVSQPQPAIDFVGEERERVDQKIFPESHDGNDE